MTMTMSEVSCLPPGLPMTVIRREERGDRG